jgi:hypothetical protein
MSRFAWWRFPAEALDYCPHPWGMWSFRLCDSHRAKSKLKHVSILRLTVAGADAVIAIAAVGLAFTR